MSTKAGRQMQPCNWQAGLQDSFWHCVLTANSWCIDTFNSATGVTNRSMQGWSMMVPKREWVLVHSSSHGDTRFTLLSFSLHCAFSLCDLRSPPHLVWAALFKTRITIAIVCLILWDHTPTESTFSQVQSWVQLHSLILSERKSEGTGNPRVKQSVVTREQTDRDSPSIFFPLWERK